MPEGTQELREMRQMSAHRGVVRCVQFDLDNRYVLSGGEDGAVYLWDVMRDTYVRKVVSHSEAIHSIHLSTGKRYMMCSDVGNMTSLIGRANGYVTWWKERPPLFFLPGDSEIFTLGPDGSFQVFNILSGGEVTQNYPRVQIVAFTD